MRQALEAEGILTNVRPIGADTAKSLFEIQVLASEVEEAQAVLCGGSWRCTGKKALSQAG